MSWNFGAVGKPAAVARKLGEHLEAYGSLPEPEQSFRRKACSLLNDVLAAYPANRAVEAKAYGNQIDAGDGKFVNLIKVELRELEGFAED